tara:strand:- start:106667 stop:107482 length:816 start_codon:yes stop_codon:yes gene_type:complete
MKDKKLEQEHFNNKSTVYGPVTSWRLGESLGIDPIFVESTCSFNCIYCQLGNIQNITDAVKEYIPAQQVIDDYRSIIDSGKKVDVITYSGSGEPTLAANIDQMIKGIRELTPNIPQYILTNATELHKEEVRKRILGLDKVIVKIDAPNEKIFQAINRPAAGITLESVIEGIKAFQKEFQGQIEVQTMFMPMNKKETQQLAEILKEIKPSLVQLNTPKRPYPMSWHRENRGNHLGIADYETRSLKVLSPEEAQEVEATLTKITGLKIQSIYR